MLAEAADILTVIGFFITIATLFFSIFINNKVNRLRNSTLFDKLARLHLKNIDKLQKELNSYFPEIVTHELRIKEILIELLTEFESIEYKVNDTSTKKGIKSLIKTIKQNKLKSFFLQKDNGQNFLNMLDLFWKSRFHNKIAYRQISDIYILVNENYNRIEKLRLDVKNKTNDSSR